jgi:hypothetical protein|tara:strand:- start:4359 stop:4916 length:558 start_codon:yes stop_codon:yes gene_type:complete
MRHFKKGNIGENLQKHRDRRGIKRMRGRKVDITERRPGPSVQTVIGASRLKKQAIIPPQNNSQTDDMISLTVLASLGVSVETGYPYNRSDFSLLEVQTDTELFDNENIFDKMQFKVISKAVGLADRFPNVANPIFQPDSSPITKRLQSTKNIKDTKVVPSVISVAGAMVGVNISSTGTTSKYFKL